MDYTLRDAQGYVQNCTSDQLDGVITEETARIQNNHHDSEVAKGAKVLLKAAQEEKRARERR